jgi:hypothetical protein
MCRVGGSQQSGMPSMLRITAGAALITSDGGSNLGRANSFHCLCLNRLGRETGMPRRQPREGLSSKESITYVAAAK